MNHIRTRILTVIFIAALMSGCLGYETPYSRYPVSLGNQYGYGTSGPGFYGNYGNRQSGYYGYRNNQGYQPYREHDEYREGGYGRGYGGYGQYRQHRDND